MSKLTLLSIPQSNFGRAVQMLLEEKGADYDYVVAKPQSDEVKAIHPFGKVPVLKHGDLMLCESAAMARYIDKSFDGPKFFPEDAGVCALVDEWVSMTNTIIDPLMIRQYVFHYIFPKGADGKRDTAAIEALKPALEKQMDIIAAAVAGDYLVGDTPTYADFNLFATLNYMPGFPETGAMIAARPAIGAYLERMNARESAKKTAPPQKS